MSQRGEPQLRRTEVREREPLHESMSVASAMQQRSRAGVPPANVARKPSPIVQLDEDTERLVLAIVSGVVATSRSRVPQQSTRLCRALAEAGRVGIPVDGQLQPPPFRELPAGPWPTHKWALKELGMSQAELRELFDIEQSRHGAQAHLAPKVVEKFVPRVLWAVVAHIVGEGRGNAAMRAENGLRSYAKTTIPGNKRREAGPPSAGAVGDQRGAYRRLFTRIAWLHERGFPHPALEEWGAVPDIAMPPGVQGLPRDDTAPRLEELRIAFRDLDRSVHDALGLGEGEDEMEAIRRMSPSSLAHTGAFRFLRDRAVFAVLVATGARITAVAELRRSDYTRDYVGPPPDSRTGAALDLHPGKSLPSEEVRRKPLPGELAEMIDAYLEYLDRVAHPRRRWFRHQHPERASIPNDPPLFVSDTLNFRPFDQFGIRKLISGAPPDLNGRGGRAALILNGRACNGQLSEEQRKYVGYWPHAVRHAAMQLAERAGRLWNEEHPLSGGERQPEPRLYGQSLLDHKEASEALRLLYGDWATQQTTELLCGRASEGIWRLLRTDEGARRRPNLTLIRGTAERLRAVEGDIEFQRQRAAALYFNAPDTPPPKQVIPQQEGEDQDAVNRHIVIQNDALLRGVDQLQLSQFEMDRRLSEHQRISDRIEQMQEVRAKLYGELYALAYDRQRFERIPDDAPPGAESVELDFEKLLGEAENREVDAQPVRQPVRSWILLSELAHVVEVNRATVARWINGQLPTDPRKRPWEPEAAPIDASLGPKYRRIWVDGIAEDFWPTTEARRRLADVLGSWPQGQGWSRDGEPTWRCDAPLIDPEGRPFGTPPEIERGRSE
jgi:integrase